MIFRAILKKAELLPSLSCLSKFKRDLSTEELAKLSPEAILNNQVREACIKRLKSANLSEKGKDNANKAAVLVPLCIHNGKLGFLYTLRSNKVSMNRGQVSFPGGMKDKSDASLEDTALRETWEELRIPKEQIDVWGSANLIVRRHITVLPVLGFIGEVEPKKLKINTEEVEEAFVYTLEKFCDPALCRYTQFRDSFTLPTYIGENHKIWGLTAVITHLVMQALAPDVYKHKLVYLEAIGQEVTETSNKSARS